MKIKSQMFWAIFFSLVFFTTSGFTVVGHRGDPIKYPEETIQLTIPPSILVPTTLNSIFGFLKMEYWSSLMMMTFTELLIHMQLYHKMTLRHLNS